MQVLIVIFKVKIFLSSNIAIPNVILVIVINNNYSNIRQPNEFILRGQMSDC